MSRAAGSRGTCEERLAITIGVWHRSGALIEDARFTQSWYQGDRLLASLAATKKDDIITGRFSFDVDHPETAAPLELRICSTPCHFGATRPWFLCRCGRRCGKLYHAGAGEFRCRHCLCLGYESQRLNPALRAIAVAQKLRMRLEGSGDLREFFPEKPKRMRRVTYERLRGRAVAAEQRAYRLITKELHQDSSGSR